MGVPCRVCGELMRRSLGNAHAECLTKLRAADEMPNKCPVCGNNFVGVGHWNHCQECGHTMGEFARCHYCGFYVTAQSSVAIRVPSDEYLDSHVYKRFAHRSCQERREAKGYGANGRWGAGFQGCLLTLLGVVALFWLALTAF
jgi:hypothetical protein